MKNLTPQLIHHLRYNPKKLLANKPDIARAAVAIILRETSSVTEMFMIRRSKREGDPWSGHMGFPGGRQEPQDHSNFSCVLRETYEEIGLELENFGSVIGELSDVNTGWRSDRPEIYVTPYVFLVAELPTLILNEEVDEVVWVPLYLLMDSLNRENFEWEWNGQILTSDVYDYEGRQIWGLSLMMIDELVSALDN